MATLPLSLPTSFNSAPLVRLLAAWGIQPAAPAAGQTVAERLAHWLPWTEAIALSQVLGDAPAAPTAPAQLDAAAHNAIVAELAKVRADLTKAIAGDPLLADACGTAVPPGDASGGADDLAALRRQHRVHQQTMEERIAALRARVRSAVAPASPALARLAALDAVLERALAAQQRQLLDQVPLLLELRWRSVGAAGAPTASGASAMPAAGALTPGATVRRALLAELETRMQPVQGLIDALGPRGTADA